MNVVWPFSFLDMAKRNRLITSPNPPDLVVSADVTVGPFLQGESPEQGPAARL